MKRSLNKIAGFGGGYRSKNQSKSIYIFLCVTGKKTYLATVPLRGVTFRGFVCGGSGPLPPASPLYICGLKLWCSFGKKTFNYVNTSAGSSSIHLGGAILIFASCVTPFLFLRSM